MHGVVVINDPFSLQTFCQQCELQNVTVNDLIPDIREAGIKWFIFIDSIHEFEIIQRCQLWDATVRFLTMEEICTRSITLDLPHPSVFHLTNP